MQGWPSNMDLFMEGLTSSNIVTITNQTVEDMNNENAQNMMWSVTACTWCYTISFFINKLNGQLPAKNCPDILIHSIRVRVPHCTSGNLVAWDSVVSTPKYDAEHHPRHEKWQPSLHHLGCFKVLGSIHSSSSVDLTRSNVLTICKGRNFWHRRVWSPTGLRKQHSDIDIDASECMNASIKSNKSHLWILDWWVWLKIGDIHFSRYFPMVFPWYFL